MKVRKKKKKKNIVKKKKKIGWANKRSFVKHAFTNKWQIWVFIYLIFVYFIRYWRNWLGDRSQNNPSQPETWQIILQ